LHKNFYLKTLGPDLLAVCASTSPLLACQDLLKTHSEKLALDRRGHGYICG